MTLGARPTRRSVASIAIIRRTLGGQPQWLTQWNAGWRSLALIGGHKRARESFHKCMVRELFEELGVTSGYDVTVADTPMIQLHFTAWSRSTHEQTAYSMSLFDVVPHDEALEWIEANPENRWIDLTEIDTQRCRDGRAVSPTVARLVRQFRQKSC